MKAILSLIAGLAVSLQADAGIQWSCIDLSGKTQAEISDNNKITSIVVTKLGNQPKVILRESVEALEEDERVTLTGKKSELGIYFGEPSYYLNITGKLNLGDKEYSMVCYREKKPAAIKVFSDLIAEGASTSEFMYNSNDSADRIKFDLKSLQQNPDRFLKSETRKLKESSGIETATGHCSDEWFTVTRGLKNAQKTLTNVVSSMFDKEPYATIQLLNSAEASEHIAEALTLTIKEEFYGQAEACSITNVRLYLKNGDAIHLYHDESD